MFAVPATSALTNVRLGAARRLLAGGIDSWPPLSGRHKLRLVVATARVPGASILASDRAAVHAVARGRADLAVVPARAVDASVRTLSVGGIDPLRNPGRYPIAVPGRDPPNVVTVSLVGDVMLGRAVGSTLAGSGDFAAPLRPMAARLAEADLTVGNLECTLSQAGPPRQGSDSFAADPRAMSGLRLAGFDVLTLANNHTGDFGPRALVETVRRVKAAGIASVGAGQDLAAAREPVVVARHGVRFGFLSFNAIGETPRARAHHPGVVSVRMGPRTGPLSEGDVATMTRAIRRLTARVDVVVVLPHWGEQYTARPVPDQRRVARALTAAGADVVVGSHPHWVQGVTTQRSAYVAYSLGNFVFDMNFSRETREGALLELTFWGGRLVAAKPVPVLIGTDYVARLAHGQEAHRILARIWSTSSP